MASFDVQETVTSTDSLPRIYRFTECDDYDITIDETGWFPMVSSKHVSLPQGLKAYVVKTVDGDMAMLDDVTSLNIKALKLALEAAKEMVAARQNLADLIDEATEYHDSIQSKFEDVAATLQKAIDAAQDVLDNPDSTVDELNDAADALQAALDAADMVVTRIAAIKADDEDAVWFDMNGRGLPTKPQTKGVYIRNGKTVIVK